MLIVAVRKTAYTRLYAALLAVGLAAIVALIVPVLVPPPAGYSALVPYLWIAAATFTAGGILVLGRARSELKITGDDPGKPIVITVDSVARLEFPFGYRCDQFTLRTKSIPMLHVYLTIWDRTGHAIELRAQRGVSHGPPPNWPERGPDVAPDFKRVARYDVASDALTQLHLHLEAVRRNSPYRGSSFE